MDFVATIQTWLDNNPESPVFALVAWLKDIIAFIAAL